MKVDSVLPADPGAPSCAAARFYQGAPAAEAIPPSAGHIQESMPVLAALCGFTAIAMLPRFVTLTIRCCHRYLWARDGRLLSWGSIRYGTTSSSVHASHAGPVALGPGSTPFGGPQFVGPSLSMHGIRAEPAAAHARRHWRSSDEYSASAVRTQDPLSLCPNGGTPLPGE